MQSKDKRDLDHFLNIECAHCAISEFVVLWEENHPDTPIEKLLGSLVEVIADVLVDAPSYEESCRGIIYTSKVCRQLFYEILAKTYKPDSRVIEVGQSTKGGLH